TRPDTIFGATFLVLAPEHQMAKSLLKGKQQPEALAYIKNAAKKTEATRLDATKTKTGVFTGSYAQHPFTKAPIPIFIADYVLASYGTGAIMGVPSNDERDHEFAEKFNLPITEVIRQNNSSEEVMINSDFLDGLAPKIATKTVIERLENTGLGNGKVQYKLRDWLFSRQRYWGEPFPIAFDENGEPHAVAIDELPVVLPAVDEYRPTDDGEP